MKEALIRSGDKIQPATGGAVITPDDATDLTEIARSIFCTTAGTIKVTCYDNTTFTQTVPAGFILPVLVRRVWSAGTTTTPVVAYW